MLRRFVGSLLVASTFIIAPGCTEGEGEVAGRYIDGQTIMTDDQAFSATLFHEDGEPTVGENNFYVRVAVPDYANPENEGRGIGRAEVSLSAAMLDENHIMGVVPEVEYEGDGVYEIEGVVLDRAGDWSLDVDIVVGDIHERATFAFTVEG